VVEDYSSGTGVVCTNLPSTSSRVKGLKYPGINVEMKKVGFDVNCVI
jgi:hypothetical protein